jgi:hypothetical protein
MTTEFRYVGDRADVLANGRPVEPGEFVKLSDQEASDNQELVDTGKLLKIDSKAAGRRSSRSADGETGEE